MFAPLQDVRDEDAILNFIFNRDRSYIASAPAVAPPPISILAPNEAIKEKEASGVAAAQANDLTKALQLLTEVIIEAPEYPSAYNNRAQVYRLMKDNEKAKTDLDRAIEISLAWLEAHRGDTSPESSAHRQVLQNAYMQRAIYYHEKGDNTAEEADLHAAAAFGNKFARMMTSSTNPYATLCSDTVTLMLRNAIKAQKGEAVDDSVAAGASCAASEASSTACGAGSTTCSTKSSAMSSGTTASDTTSSTS